MVGEALALPPTLTGPYTLAVQLLFDGFALEPGQSAFGRLSVTAGQPFPDYEVRLRAVGGDLTAARAILATYSLDGQILGVASRSVLVEPAGSTFVSRAVASGTDIPVGAAGDADLTVVIARGDEPGSRGLVWTWESPHPAVPQPPEKLVSSLGDEPQAFLKRIIQRFDARGPRDLAMTRRYLVGVGRQIADVVPIPVQLAWTAAAASARDAGRTPHVLLVTAEPYVPWELAAVRAPWDADRPAFLGAHAVVGRWTLSERKRFPSAVVHHVDAMAVVSGEYDQVPGWQRPEQAEGEAADLVSDWGAQPVEAVSAAVLDCLSGQPAADVIHFALHGRYDPTGREDGLVLVDRQMLDPFIVAGSDLTTAPLVFLNACQVGAGSEMLGDVAGLADAFLDAGACAVVAPLWAVDDVVARDVAARFYRAVFDGGQAPAEFFREERRRFEAAVSVPETHLAYLFFGHPRLAVTRTPQQALRG